MKVLMAHNYYQRASPSGENASFEAEAALLRAFGHEVYTFTRDNDDLATTSLLNRVGVALNSIWSTNSYAALRDALRTSRPDVVHFQNTFPQISPAAYYACRAAGVPVVQTLRNYRLLCPSAVLYRDNRVCEDCIGKLTPWPGVVHACYRGSRLGTAATASMLTIHRLAGTWRSAVDVYVSPSAFTRQKFIDAGYSAEHIFVKPNLVHPDPGEGAHNADYVLFVGRLGPEKGVDVLLKAWQRVPSGIKLIIVGDGPLRDRVQEATRHSPDIEWLGQRPAKEVAELMGNALFLVFPTQCYESFGRVVVEAFARGTPVLASNMGAVVELIDDGRTGWLVEPANFEQLESKIVWAVTHRDTVTGMRREVRQEYEKKYGARANHDLLVNIYERAMARRGQR